MNRNFKYLVLSCFLVTIASCAVVQQAEKTSLELNKPTALQKQTVSTTKPTKPAPAPAALEKPAEPPAPAALEKPVPATAQKFICRFEDASVISDITLYAGGETLNLETKKEFVSEGKSSIKVECPAAGATSGIKLLSSVMETTDIEGYENFCLDVYNPGKIMRFDIDLYNITKEEETRYRKYDVFLKPGWNTVKLPVNDIFKAYGDVLGMDQFLITVREQFLPSVLYFDNFRLEK